MWDFHPTRSFEVLVIFYYVFETHNTLVRHLRRHDSDTMSDEHNSLQWYDIVTFSIISHGFALGFPKRYQNNGNNIH